LNFGFRSSLTRFAVVDILLLFPLLQPLGMRSNAACVASAAFSLEFD
jgi:hypothetical protein